MYESNCSSLSGPRAFTISNPDSSNFVTCPPGVSIKLEVDTKTEYDIAVPSLQLVLMPFVLNGLRRIEDGSTRGISDQAERSFNSLSESASNTLSSL